MMESHPSAFTESVVEDAALGWLEGLGWAVKHGPEIAPGELFSERGDHGKTILAARLRDVLLPKLMSGELRVKDAERFVAEDVS
jgi:hypothetical protein